MKNRRGNSVAKKISPLLGMPKLREASIVDRRGRIWNRRNEGISLTSKLEPPTIAKHSLLTTSRTPFDRA